MAKLNILWHLIWVCTVCQLPFYGSPNYSELTPKFCLRMVRWFFAGYSGFRPPSMNDRLDISEIFLKGPLNPNQKKKIKNKKITPTQSVLPFEHTLLPIYFTSTHSSREGNFFIQKVLMFFLFLHENICCGYSMKTYVVGTP